MKLTFLGCHSAMSSSAKKNQFQSNMVLTFDNGQNMLIDCGTDIPHSMENSGFSYKDINFVYISHLHADHMGGLEWLAFNTYFDPSVEERPVLVIYEDLLEPLWQMLEPSLSKLTGEVGTLTSYFQVYPIRPVDVMGGSRIGFAVNGIDFTLIRHLHVPNPFGDIYSYGLLVKKDKETLFAITTDTARKSDSTAYLGMAGQTYPVFHDCETVNASDVHVHYNKLKEESSTVKENLWLYHYQPHAIPDWKADGFAGMVKTGQVFEF
jgi:ribonuclease BN (tRNA processing enzyme)